MKLADDEVRRYHAEGILTVPGFLAQEWIDAFRAESDRATSASTAANFDAARVEMEPNQEPDGNRVRRIYEPCEYYPVFRDYSESPDILDAVEQLIGANLLLHYSKLNMKPAELGSVVDWHQDVAYYPLTNHDTLAVLLYLDDANEENGCLRVLPGRHRADPMDHTAEGVFQGRITEPIDESEPRNLPGNGRYGNLPARDDTPCLGAEPLRQTAPHAHHQLSGGRLLSGAYRQPDQRNRGVHAPGQRQSRRRSPLHLHAFPDPGLRSQGGLALRAPGDVARRPPHGLDAAMPDRSPDMRRQRISA